MKKSVLLFTALLAMSSLFLAACGLTPRDESAVATRVAATIYARQTVQPGEVGAPTLAPAPSSTPTPRSPAGTRTPTSTSTPRLARTRTPTRSATPQPDAVVSAQAANVRAGPGTGYGVIGQARQGDKLQVVGKNAAGDWLEVTLPSGARGWVSISLLVVNLDLGKVAIAAIPPTPTPAATPTPVPTPVPRVCPSDPALVEVNNELRVDLALRLRGPEEVTMSLPAGDKRRYCLTPGEYTYTANASGYTQQTGTKTFSHRQGACDCWWWYAGLVVQPFRPCSCERDPALYTSPPLVAGAQPSRPAEPTLEAAKCPNPGVCIAQPAPQAVIRGQVRVMGTANIEGFHHYKLEWWGEGGSGWSYLLERDKPVVDGELMVLDTATVPAGRYGLRLTVVDQTGNYPEPFEIWWTVSR